MMYALKSKELPQGYVWYLDGLAFLDRREAKRYLIHEHKYRPIEAELELRRLERQAKEWYNSSSS